MTENWETHGFGLYVHWPFCVTKCPYCDFNSHVASSVNADDWQHAYLAEIEKLAAFTPYRVLNSIYFGGGTPSLMPPALVDSIIAAAQRHWGFTNDIEITLEANPSSTETEALRGFRLTGVNRVSIGVQALNDTDLKRLGRAHSAEEAVAAINKAQSEFERVSFDLIYARQFQTLDEWEAELENALRYGTTHLSLYQLTIEPETVFGKRFARGMLPGLPDEDLAADMFDLTNALTAERGLNWYEVSNYAAAGCESVHNQIYWNCGDYIGIGPGAHGRFTLNGERTATETPLSPAKWLKDARIRTATQYSKLSDEEADIEAMLMGLRQRQGIVGTSPCLKRFQKRVDHFLSEGVLKQEGDRIRVTDLYFPLLNTVLEQIVRD